MVKSPMDYFQAQDFSMPESSGQSISPAERAFLKKYLGIDDISVLQNLPAVDGRPLASFALNAVNAAASQAAGTTARENTESPQTPAPSQTSQDSGAAAEPVPPPAAAPVRPAPTPAPEAGGAPAPAAVPAASAPDTPPASAPPVEKAPPAALVSRGGALAAPDENILPSLPSLDEQLREEEIVTLVGFYVAGDVFVVPIEAVLEVIRYEEPFKLPMAPSFLPGVVNLRGRILPVVSLHELLTVEGARHDGEPDDRTRLIIICEVRGLQVGLVIDRLHTIFKARQDKLNWNADVHLGPSADLLSGLLETDEKLLGILSVERLIDKLLEV